MSSNQATKFRWLKVKNSLCRMNPTTTVSQSIQSVQFQTKVEKKVKLIRPTWPVDLSLRPRNSKLISLRTLPTSTN